MSEPSTVRSPFWKWQVSGVLLLATMIMYMDRQTLSNVSVRVTTELQLTEEQYGNLEWVFGWAFAAGALVFGFLADRVNIRYLYPVALMGWSAAGVLTGLSNGYYELLLCRTMLGLFEAGNWPCALITIQRLMSRADRGMGNSVLQSGASIGAILTPLIITRMIGGNPEPGAWRQPFIVIGLIGVLWVALWFWMIRPRDLDRPVDESENKDSALPFAGLGKLWVDARFYVLIVMVICLNSTWQLVRAWLPKFLQQGRGYSEDHALYFNSVYYIAADVGCLLAGAMMLWLPRKGWKVHRSRVAVFAVASALTALTIPVSLLPAGPLMLGILVLIAAGSLGLFPCYYSFTQELSTAHMGKVTGMLAFVGWFVSSPLQKGFGAMADSLGSYDLGFALTGLAPLVSLVVLVFLWPKETTPAPTPVPTESPSPATAHE